MKPRFEDIEWVSEENLELVLVKVTLVNQLHQELGLDNMDEILEDYYIDLSKLSGIKPWYPKEKEDGASETECLVDMACKEAIVINVNMFHLLKFWEYYKLHKDDYKNV